MGGGTDTDDGFKQLLQWGGGGDFLVIRASGDDAYNNYICKMGGARSVATLLTKQRDASFDPRVINIVNRADAIFFAGGDQWTYLREWSGSPMQEAIQVAISQRNVPVGGRVPGVTFRVVVYTRRPMGA